MNIEVMSTGQGKHVTIDDGEDVVYSGNLDENEQRALRLTFLNAAWELCHDDELSIKLSELLGECDL